MARRRRTLLERFEEKYVVCLSGCWLWTAGRSSTGYGAIRVWINDEWRQVGAHVVAYELHVGPVPAGMQLDHLCRAHDCVNPWHVEPVTLAENVLRGTGLSAANARKTECCRGHRFTPENTYVHPTSGARCCRTCRHEHYIERRAA